MRRSEQGPVLSVSGCVNVHLHLDVNVDGCVLNFLVGGPCYSVLKRQPGALNLAPAASPVFTAVKNVFNSQPTAEATTMKAIHTTSFTARRLEQKSYTKD